MAVLANEGAEGGANTTATKCDLRQLFLFHIGLAMAYNSINSCFGLFDGLKRKTEPQDLCAALYFIF